MAVMAVSGLIPGIGSAIGAGIAGGAAAASHDALASDEQKEAVKLLGRKVTPAQYIEDCIKARGYDIVPDQEPNNDE